MSLLKFISYGLRSIYNIAYKQITKAYFLFHLQDYGEE